MKAREMFRRKIDRFRTKHKNYCTVIYHTEEFIKKKYRYKRKRTRATKLMVAQG